MAWEKVLVAFVPLLMSSSEGVGGRVGGHGPGELMSCEPITIPMCQGLRYNSTRMPSFLGHRTQDEAAEDVSLEKRQKAVHSSVLSTNVQEQVQFFYKVKRFLFNENGVQQIYSRLK
jgi:hypothetical protein